jgi:hypothetical protein
LTAHANGRPLHDALRNAGLGEKDLFTDKMSGAKQVRPGLDACLQHLKSGDTLLVWRLDRLGRSLRHLIDLVAELRQREIGFRSICDGVVDTTTASGELVFHIFTVLAQFERRPIQERTRAGLTAARARGRLGGRPPTPADHPTIIAAKKSPRIGRCASPGPRFIGTWRGANEGQGGSAGGKGRGQAEAMMTLDRGHGNRLSKVPYVRSTQCRGGRRIG